ncbi:MAG TPA: hypothetical protein VLV48_01160, partial [Thermoanaerobaculia bacterium]|nr:hypothetical protein [Thermoanaerobaculia bacterium]
MRRLLTLLLLLALPAGADDHRAEPLARLGIDPSSRLELRADGRIRELEVRGPGPRLPAGDVVALLGELLRDPFDGTGLRLVEDRVSLSGRFVRFRQFVGDEPVLNGEVVLRFDNGGRLVSLSNRLAVMSPSLPKRTEPVLVPAQVDDGAIVGREAIAIADDGAIRRVERILVADPPYGVVAWDVDRDSGAVLAVT